MNFHPLFNNSVIFLDTYDAIAAKCREDAADAKGAKERMGDVVVDGVVLLMVVPLLPSTMRMLLMPLLPRAVRKLLLMMMLLLPLLPSTVRMLLVPLWPGLTKIHKIHLRLK